MARFSPLRASDRRRRGRIERARQRGEILAAVVRILVRADPSLTFDEVDASDAARAGTATRSSPSARVTSRRCQPNGAGARRRPYSGVLEPERHYIPVKRDFSNLDEALERLRDLDYLEELDRPCVRRDLPLWTMDDSGIRRAGPGGARDRRPSRSAAPPASGSPVAGRSPPPRQRPSASRRSAPAGGLTRDAEPGRDRPGRTRTFWSELCGSGIARSLGIAGDEPDALRALRQLLLRPLSIPEGLRRPVRPPRIGAFSRSASATERSGHTSRRAARTTTGVDISPTPVAMMRHRLRMMGGPGDGKVVEGSALAMPFADEHLRLRLLDRLPAPHGRPAARGRGGAPRARRRRDRCRHALPPLLGAAALPRRPTAPPDGDPPLLAAPVRGGGARVLRQERGRRDAAPHTDYTSRAQARRLFSSTSRRYGIAGQNLDDVYRHGKCSRAHGLRTGRSPGCSGSTCTSTARKRGEGPRGQAALDPRPLRRPPRTGEQPDRARARVPQVLTPPRPPLQPALGPPRRHLDLGAVRRRRPPLLARDHRRVVPRADLREKVRRFDGLKIQFLQDEYRWVDDLTGMLRHLEVDALYTCGRRRRRGGSTASGSPTWSSSTRSPASSPSTSSTAGRPRSSSGRSRSATAAGASRRGSVRSARRRSRSRGASSRGRAATACAATSPGARTTASTGAGGTGFLASCRTYARHRERRVDGRLRPSDRAADASSTSTAAPARVVRRGPPRDARALRGQRVINVISPRVLEAAALRTGLVAFPGGYSDAIRAWETYIPLEKDFSNMDDVVERSATSRAPGADRAGPRGARRVRPLLVRNLLRGFDDFVEEEVSGRSVNRQIAHTRVDGSARGPARRRPARRRTFPVRRALATARVVAVDRDLLRLAAAYLGERELRRSVRPGRLTTDLLRLGIVRRAHRGLPVTEERFSIEAAFDALSGRLVLASRPRASDAEAQGSIVDAVGGGRLREVVWNHRAFGRTCSYVSLLGGRVRIPVGYYGLHGIHEFGALSAVASWKPDLVWRVLRPLAEPPAALGRGRGWSTALLGFRTRLRARRRKLALRLRKRLGARVLRPGGKRVRRMRKLAVGRIRRARWLSAALARRIRT